MNVTAQAEVIPASRERSAVPMYFDSGANRLFGWLHQFPLQPQPEFGVVICNPIGHELICAHRDVREFAQGIAALGVPVLRFDYLGTGDSAEVDENADHLEIWTRDIIAAVGELKRRTGVTRVCLLGIRLGALLAMLAAAKCPTVDSLILIGPVVSGSRYVRDLRTAQLANTALSGSSTSGDSPEENSGRQLTLEVGGFPMSPATVKSLTLTGLPTDIAPAVRFILILDNDKLPSAKRWAEQITRTGIAVTYKAMSGLIEMAMTAPQFGLPPPRAMIDATLQWLTEVHTRNASDRSTLFSNAALAGNGESGDAHAPKLTIDSDPPHAKITERPVFISASASLFGIIAEPIADIGPRRAVILLNSGADFHIGASRMYVSFARRWAQNGYMVLRLDLAGIGDSAKRTGNIDNDVFPEEAVDDIRQVLEYLRSKYTIGELTLAGLCSGAYHSLRAAAAGLPVDQILMVNPQNYFWDKGATLQDITPAEVVHNPGVYGRRLFSPQALFRIVRGQVDLWRIAKIYARRFLLAGEALARDAARSLHVPLPNDLGRDLERIVASGTRIVLIFSQGEPGINLLKLQAGKSLSRLGKLYTLRILEAGDHIFSRREHRSVMERVLSEELYALRSPQIPDNTRATVF
jgi:alpha-beta hydrolase superfamily lysophospholipase